MKIKQKCIALCATALFFIASGTTVHAKDYLTPVGIPFINTQSVCIDDSSIVHVLRQHSDTSENIMCQFYEHDSDQIVVTFPIEINTEECAVFVFKVYHGDCLEFLFKTTAVKNDDIPKLYCEGTSYQICCD